MTIILPLPDRLVSPNGRGHWGVRSRAVREHRSRAFLATLALLGAETLPLRINRGVAVKMGVRGPLNDAAWLEIGRRLHGRPRPRFRGYGLTFYWPTARKRDDDNAPASCKAYRDGIASALGVDDSTLIQLEVPRFEIDRENPRLEVRLMKEAGIRRQESGGRSQERGGRHEWDTG